MKTTLVNLSDSEQLEMPPLGLLRLATSIKKNPISTSVQLIDMLVDRYDESVIVEHASSILDEHPDLVCISVYTAFARYVRLLIEELRNQAKGDLAISLGGPHITTAPDSSARMFDADFIVVGPGELAVTGILKTLQGARENTPIIGISSSHTIQDTDILVADTASAYKYNDSYEVDRDLVDLSKYSVPFTLITSIGCPGKCIFCASPAINGGKVFIRDISSITNEIHDLMEKHSPEKIAILDDSFTLSKTRTQALCEVLNDYGLKWFCESRVDIMDSKLLKNMSEKGCTEIQFGVECFETSLLEKIGKNVKPGQILDTIKCATDNGIRVAISLMLGLPFDNLDTMKRRIDRACELASMGVSVIEFGYLKPYPGTYLYEHIDEFGYRDADAWWEKPLPNPLCFETDTFRKSELQAMMMYANYKVQVESDAFCQATVKKCT